MAIRVGLDRLVMAPPRALRRARVGLLTGAGAVSPNLRPALHVLLEAQVGIVAIFGPEHGVNGATPAGASVPHGVERRTGLPIYSLYGPDRDPAAEMLASLTHLIVDLQDAGARFYTYISTLVALLPLAAELDLPVIVLDRPNPIGGLVVEGPCRDHAYVSFVGALSVPIRHGMTIGELTLLANATLAESAPVEIVRMEGWRRECWFDETGRVWVPPSPNLAHFTAAAVYPGLCLVEGTTLSEGRGTPLPFEVAGAPGLDGEVLAERLRADRIPGVAFAAASFRPCCGKHAGQLCSGVQLHVTDRRRFQPVRTAVALLASIREVAPEHIAFLASESAPAPFFDYLAGSGAIREGLEKDQSARAITRGWEAEELEFARTRERFLLYD